MQLQCFHVNYVGIPVATSAVPSPNVFPFSQNNRGKLQTATRVACLHPQCNHVTALY